MELSGSQSKVAQEAIPLDCAFSESELVQADLAYLHGLEQRNAERVRIAHELDLQQLRARGGL